MSKKTLLVIAAVVVLLVGATNASAYYERWDGWFNSGYLTYMNNTFDYTEGEGELEDLTYGSIDNFFVSVTDVSTFTCQSGEYEGYYIMLYPDASGWKPTGRSGHQEVDEGATWIGYAKRFDNMNQEIEDFTVYGTWDTTTEPGDCFDYDPRPPTYSAYWIVSYSNPLGIEGDGGSLGYRSYYED